MQEFIAKEKKHSQLEEVLQSPIVQLDAANQAVILINVKQLLSASAHCCIVIATSTSSNKLKNITTLYKSLAALKNIQRQLCAKDSLLTASLIGIYPSLEYPACVYELNTNADSYVSSNVLPHAGSALINTAKFLISKFLGANPAVGALGLVLHKE